MHAAGTPVRNILRVEALAVATAGLLVWAGMDGGWWRFAALVLVPDLALLGYLAGPRVGAGLYNVAHSYAVPLLLCIAGGALDHRTVLLTGAVWITHIGIDRTLGFGLKYASGFQDTHLGVIGRRKIPWQAAPTRVRAERGNQAGDAVGGMSGVRT